MAADTRSEREKMLAGDLYRAGDPELVAMSIRTQDLLRRFNATIRGEAGREDLLDQLLGSRGEGAAVRAPFHVDYGTHVHLGAGVFLNFGCVLLDVCEIRIGDMTQIGPMVQILAADHPRDPRDRDAGYENGRPVTVGRNVWIGGGAILLPGVTVGDDAIIGAGAVVTRDVAPGVTVAGNPARPLRSG